jgi:hypothetical protein
MVVKKRLKRTRVIDWLCCAVVCVIALAMMLLSGFANLYGITPKAELSISTGVARNMELENNSSSSENKMILRFAVNEFTVEYSSIKSNYDRILQAVQNQTPMTVAVSTKRETLFPRQGWVPLYELWIGVDKLVGYDDTVKSLKDAPIIIFACGFIFAAISFGGLWTCFKGRNQPTEAQLRLEAQAEAARQAECYLYIYLPGSINPEERHEGYDHEVNLALESANLGEVCGGGTMLDNPNADGETGIEFCGIDIYTQHREQALSLLHQLLTKLNAPLKSEIHYLRDGVALMDVLTDQGWLLSQTRSNVEL